MKHWIWKDSNYLKAWLCILMEANHEDSKIMIHGELIECKRGQSLNSINTWVKLFGRPWSPQKTRTFFSLLEKEGQINTQGLRKTTKLTICNYDAYQIEQQTNNTQNNKQITHKQHTNNNKQECKEYKSDKNEAFFHLCDLLKSSIIRHNPEARINGATLSKWANTFRLMVEIDKRSYEQIQNMINIIYNTSQLWDGWKTNILSAEKLRLRWNEGKLKNKDDQNKLKYERMKEKYGNQ